MNEKTKAIFEARYQAKWNLFEKKFKGSTNLTEAQERKIFEYAWEEGHSSGEYEVEGHFYQLVELVESCLK